MHNLSFILVYLSIGLTNFVLVQSSYLEDSNSLKTPAHLQSLMSINCSEIEQSFFPFMKIQHSDELHNSSFSIIESSDPVNEHSGYLFSITCIALYPIEWVVNYFYNGYPKNGNNYGLHLQIHRKVSVFPDLSTYKFTITSKLRYKNNHGFKNFSFTCKSVDRPSCLQKTLYTSFDEEHDGKHGVKINVVQGPSSSSPISSSTSLQQQQGDADPDAKSCNFTVYEKNLGSNLYSLRCKFKDNAPGTVKVIHQCSNAIACMAYHQQHRQPILSERCAEPFSGNGYCASCQERVFRLSQGYLACVDKDDKDHIHHDSSVLFFFSSVPQDHLNHSRLYYDSNMGEVNGEDMLSFARVNKKISTLVDQIHVVCNTSSYYFASGVKFGVKYSGLDELVYTKAIAIPSSPGSEYYPANVYEGDIPIRKSSGTIERVWCLAPVWNSFVWINKSIDVPGTSIAGEGTSPHIAIAVGVTLLLTTLCCCLLFGLCWIKILRRKLSKFGKLLTPEEIDEFRRQPTAFENEKLQNNEYDYINSGILNEKDSGDISYLEIRREQLLLDETVVLGKGHFGKVLKGVYKDDRVEKVDVDVAVKTLKTKSDVTALKSLLSELKIMATVGKNLNVVNLIGACTKRMAKGEVYVAVEYCALGNMQNYLRNNRDKFKNQLHRDILIVETPYSLIKSIDDDIIQTYDLIRWAWEISKGMQFLSSKKVIHGDLACRNILLTKDKVAKVADFGLSRQLVDYYYVKEDSDVAMPWKWMSIESLRDMKFSIQSDIWSLGVTMWELFTLSDIPYLGCSWSTSFIEAFESGHRLGKPPYATTEMYELMLQCWKEEPSERPSFFTIKSFFEDILTTITYQDYMQLDLGENSHSRDEARSPLLTLTPTIEISDCEVDDDVFEQ